MDIAFPGVFSERDTHVKNEKYVFISYSHKDKEFVYPLLSSLYDAGLNYWYDRELKYGDDWTEEAEQAMRSDNCLGVIFMLSPNSLSNAIGIEIEICKSKIEALGKNKVKVLPIGIGVGSYYQLVQKRFIDLKDEEPASLMNKLPFKRICDYLDFFSDNWIFTPSTNPTLKEDIIADLKAFSPELFSTSNEIIKVLENEGLVKREGDGYVFPFSKYPMTKDLDISFLGEYYKNQFGDLFYNDKANSRKYRMDLVKWKVLTLTNRSIKAISDIYLGCCYYHELNDRLEKVKAILTKHSSETSFEVRLPRLDELIKYPKAIPSATITDFGTKELAGLSLNQLGFWAVDNDKIVVVNDNKKVIDDNQISIGAIRLIIELDKENLSKFIMGEF